MRRCSHLPVIRPALLECLAETIWQAQRGNTAPDQALYLECVEQKLRL